MRLWWWWIDYTKRRACEQTKLDRLLFGNSFIVRRWWGWQRLDPFSVVTTKLENQCETKTL